MRGGRSSPRWGMMSLAEPTSWIKLDRNILEWRWFKASPITTVVFLYILLRANTKPGDFGNVHILRGQLVTSHNRIAADLNLTVGQVRTALDHLKSTGEIRTTSGPKYSIITIVNYSKYQGGTAGKPQANNRQAAGRQQQFKKNRKEIKENKENKEYAPKFWELDIPKQAWGRFQTEDDWHAWKDANIEEVTSWLTN